MTPSATYCRNCGKPLTEEEKAIAGTTTCSSCLAARTAAGAAPPFSTPPTAPFPPPADSGISPGLAFFLGLIPGVGAIYNGQYAKGLMHVVVFGILLSIANAEGDYARQVQPLAVMLAVVWVPYMAFEAYHTAKKRMLGQPVDEFSSLAPSHPRVDVPSGPIVLIAVGVLFLLSNLELLRISQVIRFWPALLIGLGVYQLWQRSHRNAAASPSGTEERHES